MKRSRPLSFAADLAAEAARPAADDADDAGDGDDDDSNGAPRRRARREGTLVLIGTPFDIENQKDVRKPVWQQEVRDERGRRRFHGAFTGGFSAGYFNTVGSAEGFTPASFMSSRSQRSTALNRNAQDFMDEEDLREMKGELAAKSMFGTGTTAASGDNAIATAGPGTVSSSQLVIAKLSDILIAPTEQTIGVQLLRKLGWRPGHGIGPRTRQVDEADDDKMLVDGKIRLAPRNTMLFELKPKLDVFGLGFDAHKDAPEFADVSTTDPTRFAQQPTGTNVYDDDEDYLATSNNKAGARYTFAVSEGTASENTPSVNSRSTTTRPKKGPLKPALTVPQLCHDGRHPLEGFRLTNKEEMAALEKWFAPPEVPSTFTGIHDSAIGPNILPRPSDAPQLHPDERARLLGETVPERSTNEAAIPGDSDRASNLQVPAAAPGMPPMPPPGAPNLRLPPKLDAPTAVRALGGFMPYSGEPAKQERYRRFLEYHATPTESRGALDITIGELDEFYKAARTFRPISSMLSSRFVSSALPADEPPKVIPGLQTFNSTSTKPSDADEDAKARESALPPPPKRLGREVMEWEPARLLCKRFNIAPPMPPKRPELSEAGVPMHPNEVAKAARKAEYEAKESDIMTDMLFLASQARAGLARAKLADEKAPGEPGETPQEKEEDHSTISGLGKSAEEWSMRERPPMDLFATIFGDEDDEDQPKEQPKEQPREQPREQQPGEPGTAPPVVGRTTPSDQLPDVAPPAVDHQPTTAPLLVPPLATTNTVLPAPRVRPKKDILLSTEEDTEEHPGSLEIRTPAAAPRGKPAPRTKPTLQPQPVPQSEPVSTTEVPTVETAPKLERIAPLTLSSSLPTSSDLFISLSSSAEPVASVVAAAAPIATAPSARSIPTPTLPSTSTTPLTMPPVDTSVRVVQPFARRSSTKDASESDSSGDDDEGDSSSSSQSSESDDEGKSTAPVPVSKEPAHALAPGRAHKKERRDKDKKTKKDKKDKKGKKDKKRSKHKDKDAKKRRRHRHQREEETKRVSLPLGLGVNRLFVEKASPSSQPTATPAPPDLPVSSSTSSSSRPRAVDFM